ncbi:hypothetical protein E2562_012476 [Oryza meyeriana var. granulata]|uniref:Berberine/berberine-like domain-containing protein n=1 Tax=Oryza meyeriana var. granulata TaxID=110450 RepID=A0A6G1BWH4_9ORYZ|nr:hypothetical protein E2562_012476 [Oryza meyeriana var. granulata]
MLTADNVLDALLVNVDGRVLDRSSMGEDVFWAIRRGGGASWGVVYAWKGRLVQVPDTYVGPALPDEVYLSVFLTIGGGSSPKDGNVTVSFTGLVLGPKKLAMSVPSERFPELGLVQPELSEMSWVQSAARFAGLSSLEELTSRGSKTKHYATSKSDYVQSPNPRDALAAIVRYLADGPAGYMILDPYGGAMARAGSADTPFPHRAGNLYSIQYGVTWEAGDGDGEAQMRWLQALSAYMAPHVSKNPRAAYVNYIDLDLGSNALTGNAPSSSSSPVSQARSTWGSAYFSAANFDRLSGPRHSSTVPMSSAIRRAFHR